jgi:5-methylcytosine-specific restriction endonuclease McrA
MTPKRRAELLLAYGGRCNRCRGKIMAGQRWIANHILPLEFGGRDEIGNLEPLHEDPCDKATTSADLKRIAKMRRQAKMSDEREPSQLQSRGFEKNLTKRMDSSVVRRLARDRGGR